MNHILNRFIWNGLGLAVIAAPIALGAVHWPVWITLAALGGALLVASALLSFRRGYRVRLDGFVVLGLVAAAWMLFQLLPLGDSTLAAWSPGAFDAVENARALGYEVTGRLSIAPVETVKLLVLVGMALCFYIVAFNVSYREGTGNKLLAMVGIGGAVVALITMVHLATGSKLLLGFYSPEQGMSSHKLLFSTFVNNNNAAMYLNLCLLVLAGQWQKAQFGKTKGIFAVLVFLVTIASIGMLSRGGILALLLAGGLLAAMSRWSGGPRKRTTSAALSTAGVVITLVCVGIFLAVYNMLLGQVERTSLIPFMQEDAKLMVWEKARAMLSAWQPLGAGGGAFGAAFAPLNDISAQAAFPHAENELLEPLLEFGIPVGVALLGGAVVLLWRRFPFARSEGYYAGALAGLFAVAIHSLGDFGLRIPGVAIPVAVTLGALSGAFARERTKTRSWRLVVGGLKLIPVAATAYLLLIVGGAWARTHSTEAYYQRLAVADEAAMIPPAEAETALATRAVELHPRDSHLHTLLGRRQEMAGDLDRAASLYARANELCPLCIPPRIGMVRVHYERGEVEALLGVLLDVVDKVPSRMRVVFDTVYKLQIPVAKVVEVWKQEPDLLHGMVRHLYRERHLAQTEAMIRASIQQGGHDARLLNYLGLLYLEVGRPDKADEVATYLLGFFPDAPSGYLIQARVFVREGRLEEAMLMYEEARQRSDNAAVDLEMMGLLARMRRWDQFEALAAELRMAIGERETLRARFHMLMAVREEMRGEYYSALQALDQAETTAPFDIQIPLQKARLQLKLGRPDRASAEYRKALRIDPTSVVAAQGLRDLESSRGPTIEE